MGASICGQEQSERAVRRIAIANGGSGSMEASGSFISLMQCFEVGGVSGGESEQGSACRPFPVGQMILSELRYRQDCISGHRSMEL
jgi:hypothetical protein